MYEGVFGCVYNNGFLLFLIFSLINIFYQYLIFLKSRNSPTYKLPIGFDWFVFNTLSTFEGYFKLESISVCKNILW